MDDEEENRKLLSRAETVGECDSDHVIWRPITFPKCILIVECPNQMFSIEIRSGQVKVIEFHGTGTSADAWLFYYIDGDTHQKLVTAAS